MSTTTQDLATVQLEAALIAANKYAVITDGERDSIRAAFAKLSEADKQAFLDGHLERPLRDLAPEKRERLIALMHAILSHINDAKGRDN